MPGIAEDVEIFSNLLQNASADSILCDYRSHVPMRAKGLDATGAKGATFRDGIRDETWLFSTCKALLRASVDVEVYLDIHIHLDGLAVQHPGLEFVLADGFDGLFIQPHTHATGHANVRRISMLVYH
jgi:hypothetical protein